VRKVLRLLIARENSNDHINRMSSTRSRKDHCRREGTHSQSARNLVSEDDAAIGTTLQIVDEQLAEAMDLRSGHRTSVALRRVGKSGGRIDLAKRTPGGFIGQTQTQIGG
jgi:hypothetical protein